jgi:hypothetical protein
MSQVTKWPACCAGASPLPYKHTHSADAQLLDDAVMRGGSPDHWRESHLRSVAK